MKVLLACVVILTFHPKAAWAGEPISVDATAHECLAGMDGVYFVQQGPLDLSELKVFKKQGLPAPESVCEAYESVISSKLHKIGKASREKLASTCDWYFHKADKGLIFLLDSDLNGLKFYVFDDHSGGRYGTGFVVIAYDPKMHIARAFEEEVGGFVQKWSVEAYSYGGPLTLRIDYAWSAGTGYTSDARFFVAADSGSLKNPWGFVTGTHGFPIESSTKISKKFKDHAVLQTEYSSGRGDDWDEKVETRDAYFDAFDPLKDLPNHE